MPLRGGKLIEQDLKEGNPVELFEAETIELDYFNFCRDTKRSKKRIEKHDRRLSYLYNLKCKGVEWVVFKNGQYRAYYPE